MRKIYFVRHAERDTSVQDDTLAPLTTAGQIAADQLAIYFQNKKITVIYTSPLTRGKETILPTAKALHLPLQEVAALKERKVGAWVVDFKFFTQQQWRDFTYHLLEGESLHAVLQRILPRYQQILLNSRGNIIIVGHGTALSVLFHALTGGKFSYEDFCQLQQPDMLVARYDEKQQFIRLTHENSLTK